MNRRLDGPRLDAGRLETTGHEARHAEGTRAHTINRRRLKGVGRSADGAQETTGTSQTAHTTGASFQRANGGKSLDEILTDFVMPRLPEPAILRRSVSILQHCVTDLVPTLDGGEQLRGLAKALMQEEIDRHRDLLVKLQGGSES